MNLPSTPNRAASELRSGAEWKFSLLGGLAEPFARRIFTAAEFYEFVQRYRVGASVTTARSLSEMLVSSGALRRVSSGIFLNRRSIPPTEITEAASHIRNGAVISLHSVLGEVGFLNNPPSVVFAVLPTSATKRPKLGEARTSAGDIFRFHGLAERFFPQNDQERFKMLQPGRPCEMFRPEAALLHWLHLANMQRSSLWRPPFDVDMSTLDLELLDRLAERWDLGGQLLQWRTQAEAVNFGEEPEARAPTTAPTQEAHDASAAARARLMARRSSPSGS